MREWVRIERVSMEVMMSVRMMMMMMVMMNQQDAGLCSYIEVLLLNKFMKSQTRK
jgi:hypothetical protein